MTCTLGIGGLFGNRAERSTVLQNLQSRGKVQPMNLQLDDVALFVRILELGSLSSVARERNVPVSQVTRALARLEKTCRARLLHRNTHGLSLTDEGDNFLLHARRLIDTTAELQGTLSARAGGPSGWVRLSVSAILAQAVIAPSLPGLYERYPALHVDISADDRIVDMARDGIDVAIRTGTLASDNVVARPIGHLTRSLYAAPSYVKRFGVPSNREELAQHRLLTNTASPTLNRWASRHDGTEVLARGHTRTDNTAVVVALLLNGVGIARIVDVVALPLVNSGALVPILSDQFATAPVPMFAVMLQERHRLPKVRACIDHWADWLSRIA
jgi:DNA-binding transcriptional LysR family regulator